MNEIEEMHINYAVSVLVKLLKSEDFSRHALLEAMNVFERDIREAFRGNDFDRYDEMTEAAVEKARRQLNLLHS